MNIVLALAAVPAAFLTMAQTAPTAEQKAYADYQNKIVCEKQEVVGSRLAVRKVCKTRAEWMEERLADRQQIDRLQTMQGDKRSANGQ